MKSITKLIVVVMLGIILDGCSKAPMYDVLYRNETSSVLWVSNISWGQYDLSCGNLGKNVTIMVINYPIPSQTTIKWKYDDKEFTKSLNISIPNKKFDGAFIFTFKDNGEVDLKSISREQYDKMDLKKQ